MKDEEKIRKGFISILFEDFSPEEIEVEYETDIVEKGGYTYPEFTITAIHFREEKLDRGSFFDLLSYLIEEEVYYAIKREAKDQD